VTMEIGLGGLWPTLKDQGGGKGGIRRWRQKKAKGVRSKKRFLSKGGRAKVQGSKRGGGRPSQSQELGENREDDLK